MTDSTVREDTIIPALQSVIDPEVGVNVYDLGLIYATDVEGNRVRIRMTMTSPACPMGSMLTGQVRAALLRIPGVEDAEVSLVWEPAWSPALMTPAARKQLGWPDD